MERYPLVCYLDGRLTKKVRSLQREISAVTGSRGSLVAWEPHLTVGSEVWLDKAKLDAYVRRLRDAVADVEPFRVQIKGLGFMDDWTGGKLPGNTSYGVYLKVNVNPELEQLARTLKTVTDEHKAYYPMPWPYSPHVTLAYKDLTAEGYKAAKARYQQFEFDDATEIEAISVAKHDSGSGRNTRFVDLRLGG